jgi:hypothetical protein
MIIVVECRQCGQKYLLPEEAEGKSKRCRMCQAVIRIPRKSFSVRLKKRLAAVDSRKAYLTLGGVVAVLLGVGTVAALLYEPSADTIRARVHHALFAPTSRGEGVVLHGTGRHFSTDRQRKYSFAQRGRFLLETKRRSDSARSYRGYDGAFTWERRESGVSRRLDYANRDSSLFWNWILGGYWTHPQAPFLIEVNRSLSTESIWVLDLALEGGRYSGTIAIDKVTNRPKSFTLDAGHFSVHGVV